MPPLDITPHEYERGRVLVIEGEIDLATEARFHEAVLEALRAQPFGRVVLDCAGLSFIDSSGLRVLIRAHKAAKEHHSSLLIASPTPRVAQTLHVTSLDTRIPVFPSTEAALAAPLADPRPR